MNIYSARAEERRKQFNRIIDGCSMVLMNHIPEVDGSVWENWETPDPLGNDECEFEDERNDEGLWICTVHGHGVEADEQPYECEGYEPAAEVYQWFAVGDSDAEFLKRHNQYITYSDMLDTYFLAITHWGTSWDYVDSMVNDILGDN